MIMSICGAAVSLFALALMFAGFLRSPRAWVLFGLVAGIGPVLMFGPVLGPSHALLANSGHLAAALSVGWAIAVWLGRFKWHRLGRLTAEHPGIVTFQTLCLCFSLWAVLAALYFMVTQFGLAMVQMWRYTVFSPAQWAFSDSSGTVDLLAVALSCLIVTHATSSAVLLVPMFWTLFLGMVRQALLIPPVLAVPEVAPERLVGLPTIWAVAILIGTAVLLGGFVSAQHWSWQHSRRRALATDVYFLLRPPRNWPGLELTVLVVGLFVMLLGCLLLVFPTSAGAFQNHWLTLACALSLGSTAACVFIVVHRGWQVSLCELGFGLLSLAICSVVLIFLPAAPSALVDRFPLIFNGLVFGCALCTALWLWLSVVWEQQLDAGRAWTTAGRMVPVARRSSFMTAALGVLFAFQMGVWPLLYQAKGDDDSPWRVLLGLLAIGLLGVAIARGYLNTRRPAFRSLIVLVIFALVQFGFIRLLPRLGMIF